MHHIISVVSYSRSVSAPLMAERERFIHRMRRNAEFGVFAGAIIVVAAMFTLLQGRSFSGASLLGAVFGVGLLAVSVRILLPSYPQRVHERWAKLDGLSEEGRRAYVRAGLRRGWVVVFAALLIEVPLAVLLWPLTEWQPWIAAILGTTALMLALFTVGIVQQRRVRS